LPSLLGSACLQVTNAIVASPIPFQLYDDDGTPLGNVTIRGGDVNHWVEDKDGYALCGIDHSTHVHERHLKTAQHERKHVRVHHKRNNGPSVNTTTTSGNNSTHFYYCAQTADGDVVPNTNYPVANTDPNTVSNDTLPSHVHRTEAKAVRDCGEYCEEEIREGAGARKLEALQLPTKGIVQNLVVAFRFSDHARRTLPPTENLEILMNSEDEVPGIAPTGGVKKVFLDNSNGKFELHSTVTEWVTLDSKYTESYCADQKAGLDSILHECLHDALSKVDPAVDFSEFESNGDGYIDSIAFLHSGYGAEHTNNVNRIWSHKWKFYEKINGDFIPMVWISEEGVKVHTFHISPALWGSWGSEIGRVGVIAHETAHFLGLDDLYDNDIGDGIGYWSLMANAFGFDQSQHYPPFLDPYSKGLLDWATFVELTESENGAVATPSYTHHTYYKISKGFPDGEYLIIENRQREGFDDMIAAAGLLIWHIDELKDNNREEGYPGQLGSPGWPENNKHYKVAVLSADGSYHLERGGNPGDAGDVFTEAGVTSLDSSSNAFPNTASYQNGNLMETGIQIKNIRSDGDNILFDVCFDNTCAFDDGDDGDNSESHDNGSSTECKDLSDWIDSDGDECGWYEMNEKKGCPIEGDVIGTNDVTASEACCHCGGGDGDRDTYIECEMVEGWIDRYGDTCAWYEENQKPGCRGEGETKGMAPAGTVYTAWKACCYCNKQ